MLQRPKIIFKHIDATLELMVRVRRHLNLDSLETDAEMLQLVVILIQLLLQVRHALLQEHDALGGAFGALDEEIVDVLHFFLSRAEVGGDLGQLLVQLVGFGNELLGVGFGDARGRVTGGGGAAGCLACCCGGFFGDAFFALAFTEGGEGEVGELGADEGDGRAEGGAGVASRGW